MSKNLRMKHGNNTSHIGRCNVTFSRSFTSFTSHFHVPSGWTSSSFRYWHGLTWVQPEVPVIECWVRWPQAHWSVQSGAMRRQRMKILKAFENSVHTGRNEENEKTELPRATKVTVQKKDSKSKNIWKSSGCSGFRLAIGINLLSVKQCSWKQSKNKFTILRTMVFSTPNNIL